MATLIDYVWLQIKPIYNNKSQGAYGKPFTFEFNGKLNHSAHVCDWAQVIHAPFPLNPGTVTRDAQNIQSESSSNGDSCINLHIFIGAIVGVVVVAVAIVIIVLTCVCLGMACKKKKTKSKKFTSYGKGMDNPVYDKSGLWQ